MSKEYSQQHITSFFQQFKKLDNSYPIEKVHQIINDPNAMARYKVKQVKPLNLIIMTFIISLSVLLALWFAAPDIHQENSSAQSSSVNTHEPALSGNSDQTNDPALQTDVAVNANINNGENVHQHDSSAIEMQQAVKGTQKEPAFSDTVIDGSKFILELSNKELEKLGFQINHYAVYYRNHYKDQKVFYLATHPNGRFSVGGENVFYNMKDFNPLQIDTIPENCIMKHMKVINIGTGYTPENRIREDIEYRESNNSFYPLFNTNQTGEIEKVNNELSFEDLADTLLPVVIKCSQLDLEKKRDQFFWFITNNDFYNNLPNRYSWVKEEFEILKAEKRKKQDKLSVNYKIDEWNKELLIPENVVLDGKSFIVQFSKEELKKIGLFKKDNNRWFYSHRTPYSGSAGGFTEIVNGKLQTIKDTTFNVDYYIKYKTDSKGDFLVTSTSIQQIDEFFINDDILLPVQAENNEGTIYWFTLSDEIWKLVPKRYTYLREHYNKMLYNKSIEPNRDFVKHFIDPFKKVGVNVSFIELTKKELENIGFKYSNGGAVINCGFGKNWIHYSFEDHIRNLPDAILKMHKSRTSPVFESVNYISPNRRFVKKEWVDKFDLLYAAANQGYQFVYITDSLGRHMHKINIKKEDIQINGEDFKYLIPVMVRNSKFVTPNCEDRVFWFTPTDAFFSRLPNRIKNELKKEYYIVSSDGKSSELSACTYFESCRSTLKVEKMKVYPNPAQKEITIDFDLKNTQEGEILLANIAGQQIKVLKPKSKFNEGANSVKCQLEGIKPGIYLVTIVTELGFKTERIIVSE